MNCLKIDPNLLKKRIDTRRRDFNYTCLDMFKEYNLPVEIYERGLIQRDFVHVDDVVDSIYLSILNNSGFNIYNIGSGKPIDLTSVAEIMKVNYNSKSKIEIVNKFRDGDVLGAFSDNLKASKILNYQPKIELSVGLNNYCDWFKYEYEK